jgi:hypothetical protein
MPSTSTILAALGLCLALPPAHAQTIGRSVIQHDVSAALADQGRAAPGPGAALAELDYSAGPWIDCPARPATNGAKRRCVSWP